jgi:hypothetical protein
MIKKFAKVRRILAREADKKGIKGKDKAAYEYGVLHKIGWKPGKRSS